MLLYQKIRNYIQTLISEGQLTAGSKLPSERTLQEHFSSTRITVREALIRLEAEGLIYSQKRRGWFVTATKLKWHPATKVNFNELATEQGFTPSTKVISIGRESAQSLAPYFDSAQLFHLTRVRSLDERLVMYEDIFCDATRFEQLEQMPLDGSITQVMAQQYNVQISNEHCTISVTVLPDDVAILLEKNSGAPCLKVIRKRYESDGKLADYNIEYWLHDAIEMVMEGH